MKLRFVLPLVLVWVGLISIITFLFEREGDVSSDFTRMHGEQQQTFMAQTEFAESVGQVMGVTEVAFDLDSMIVEATVSAQPGNRWQLVVAGDVSTGRSVNARMTAANDFMMMFRPTAPWLRLAAVTMVNLEGTLLADCPLVHEGFSFCGNPRTVDGLLAAGVDVVSLANNHSDDFGTDGLLETKEIVTQAGIRVIKPMDYELMEVKGIEVAFVGVDTTIRAVDERELAMLLDRASAEAEVVIPYFHWGNEYQATPSAQQVSLAKLSVQHGADLVLGAHPHWVQAIEVLDGVPVIYSHGNFVFDQLWSEETREGVVGVYTFEGQQLVGVGFVPIYINTLYQPELASQVRGRRILGAIKSASQALEVSRSTFSPSTSPGHANE